MRGIALALALVSAGCAQQHHGGMTGDPPLCPTQLTIGGAMQSTTVGPLAIDGDGVNVCLELDATQLHRAHFAAATGQETGTASSFAATLEDANSAPVLDGWDVTVGRTDPHTFLNLEWDPPAGAITTVTLWVHARAGTATTSINLSLIDPLD